MANFGDVNSQIEIEQRIWPSRYADQNKQRQLLKQILFKVAISPGTLKAQLLLGRRKQKNLKAIHQCVSFSPQSHVFAD